MVSKRMKVLVSVLAAVVLLTAGGATAVMADDGSVPTSNTANTTGLLPRVAEILDIPQEDLVNAFNQARREMREEACIRYLDKAVEKGRITEEEADEIREWRAQRPEVMDSGLLQRSFGFKALGSRHMWGSHNRGWCWPRLPRPAE